MQQLRQELSDAKADLVRDEKIFAEKINEVRVLRRTNAALKRENEQLKQATGVPPSTEVDSKQQIQAASVISPDRQQVPTLPI